MKDTTIGFFYGYTIQENGKTVNYKAPCSKLQLTDSTIQFEMDDFINVSEIESYQEIVYEDVIPEYCWGSFKQDILILNMQLIVGNSNFRTLRFLKRSKHEIPGELKESIDVTEEGIKNMFKIKESR